MPLREHRSRARGFTLLEILVVVVIIGIIASFAVLSVGNRSLDDRLNFEARRLEQLIALAADEAVLQGAELGFARTADGYAFFLLREEATDDGPKRRWVPLDETSPLKPRQLGAPYELELRVEGRAVGPLESPKDPADEIKPQVLLMSSGEVSEFELALRARDYPVGYLLKGDATGALDLQRVGG